MFRLPGSFDGLRWPEFVSAPIVVVLGGIPSPTGARRPELPIRSMEPRVAAEPLRKSADKGVRRRDWA